MTELSGWVEVRDMRKKRDPLYLFLCHIEWRDSKSVQAYMDLVATLDDTNSDIRAVAEDLLSQRLSPRPKDNRQQIEVGAVQLW